MKATYGEIIKCDYHPNQSPEALEPAMWTECREIFKSPVTDDGTKKSARGLIQVYKDDKGKLTLKDQCTWEEEAHGELKTVYEYGELLIVPTLSEIRQRINDQI